MLEILALPPEHATMFSSSAGAAEPTPDKDEHSEQTDDDAGKESLMRVQT